MQRQTLADLPSVVVFHVQNYLERPNVLVLATASKKLQMMIGRKNSDPCLSRIFAARNEVVVRPGEMAPESFVIEAFAHFRRRFTPLAWAANSNSPVSVPPPFRHPAILEAWSNLYDETIKNDRRIERITLLKRAVEEAQEHLAGTPWKLESIKEAVASLCWMGRISDAERIVRWRLLWNPSENGESRILGEVLIHGRQYDQAIQAMGVRDEFADEPVINLPATGPILSVRANNSHKVDVVAKALLLQGRARAALALIRAHEAEPLTQALVYHVTGHADEAEVALNRIIDKFHRAIFFAWKGEAVTAITCAYVGIREASDQGSTFPMKGLLDICNSPFLDPIRQHPQWIETLNAFGLTREVISEMTFDFGPVDTEATRHAAEMTIRENAESVERSFNAAPTQKRVILGLELFYLGRFEQAEKVLRREAARDPGHWSGAHRWLGELLLARGRLDEARVVAETIKHDYLGGGLLARIRLLTGDAQLVYDQEMQAEQPDRELLALAAHALGRFAQRDTLCAELEDYPVSVIQIKGWSGQADEVFDWLHHTVAIGSAYEILRFVVHSPFMAPIRNDPRWPLFLRTVNMAPDQLAQIPLRFELLPLPSSTPAHEGDNSLA
ncbi:MAG: tetratricopeptide repeat protein [Pseudomonadota bacterium]